MKQKDFISTLQTIFGATKGELIFVALLLFGLLAGLVISITSDNNTNAQTGKSLEALYRALDSLSEAEKTTYTGADLQGNKVPELAAGDTIVKNDDNIFPHKEKKQLPTSPININTATKSQLSSLPGISGKTADKIVAYRNNHTFHRPEDIMKVKGIGKKKFKKLREYIVVK